MYHAGRTHRCSRRRRSGSAAQRARTPPPLATSAVARERFGDSTPLDAGDAAAPAPATVVTAVARVFVRRIENGATPRSSSAESTSRSFRRSWPRRDVPRCRRCQPRARRGEPPGDFDSALPPSCDFDGESGGLDTSCTSSSLRRNVMKRDAPRPRRDRARLSPDEACRVSDGAGIACNSPRRWTFTRSEVVGRSAAQRD